MSHFLVEVYTPRETANFVADVSLAAEQASQEAPEVRLLQAIFVPEDETCFYVYSSSSAAAVGDAATRAGLRFDRITEAVSLETA
jgi:hypothetical protein